jgi:hemerythrin superfamily protein
MTRRLNPEDRIQELSGASVPFSFDVHAMMFNKDAPSLENALHQKFSDKRLNLVNPRKEYFRVSLDEITDFAKAYGAKVEFTKLAEAKQFRESESIRLNAQQSGEASKTKEQAFPDKLFAEIDDD